jgi:hypothetical protein
VCGGVRCEVPSISDLIIERLLLPPTLHSNRFSDLPCSSSLYTDKEEEKNSLIYKDIQMVSGAKYL